MSKSFSLAATVAGFGALGALLFAPGCSSPFSSCTATRTCPLPTDAGASGEAGAIQEVGGHGGSPEEQGGEAGDGTPGSGGDGVDVAGSGGADDSGGTSGTGGAGPSHTNPSCAGLPSTCGSTGKADCCSSSMVAGVSTPVFFRSYDGADYTDKKASASVSDFGLDTYEITVGRFRKFLESYPSDIPKAGSGRNLKNTGDVGWDAAWTTAHLPMTQLDLTAAIQCDPNLQTWTMGNDSMPMNCLSWYEAEAFCIWDEGRLPTEAEWNYAAAGGIEQRIYPWGAAAPTASYAVAASVSGIGTLPAVVGSKSKGIGKWGQADMAGNVWEWTQDWYTSAYPSPCADCANLTAATRHSIRGGGFQSNNKFDLTASNRFYDAPVVPARSTGFGARCARNVP